MITINSPHSFLYPWHSVFAKNGVVATSQRLAADIGLTILKQGGNAIDAAIATAAAMPVCEPTANGIGGDAMVIVWFEGKMYGLNGSGKSPASISIEAIKQRGYTTMPQYGIEPITVPGIPKAWADLQERFGTMPLASLLEPAAQLAEQGYALSPQLAQMWQRANDRYNRLVTGDMFDPWYDLFAPDKTPPKTGEVWSSKDMAQTLRTIGRTQAKDFYEGSIAKQMVDYIQAKGGFLSLDDLAQHESEWVTPLSVHYKGVDVWELPPNGQGIVALQALKMMADETHEYGDLESMHRQIEAMKLAFADALSGVTDPTVMDPAVEAYLTPEYIAKRKAMITDKAQVFTSGIPQKGGTIYLCTADKDGNMVSYIQSNFNDFGSGVVIPSTGISMQNRGHIFSLDPAHANALQPKKRTYHTIIPGFITKQGAPLGPFGIMGGYMQPQAHLQVLLHLIDHQMDPQSALDAPRWQWSKDKTIQVEPQFPKEWLMALREKGHEIEELPESISFGRGQIILRLANGTYVAASERRAEGIAAIY